MITGQADMKEVQSMVLCVAWSEAILSHLAPGPVSMIAPEAPSERKRHRLHEILTPGFSVSSADLSALITLFGGYPAFVGHDDLIA